jgi:mRNA interferase MazF
MTRGSIVVMAARGAYTGKPRPAVIVESDLFNPTHSSISVCPITSDCIDAPLFRVDLPPGDRTGLSVISQVMIDKLASVPRAAISRTIGACDVSQIDAIDDALRAWLAL